MSIKVLIKTAQEVIYLGLAVTTLAVGGLPGNGSAQTAPSKSPVPESKPPAKTETKTEPKNEARPNALNRSVFSIQGGERLVAEAMTAIGQQNYDLAVSKLQDARQVYNQLSNFYQDLTASFSGIDNRIADTHRQNALKTAQLRDTATYQLAIAYRGKNQPELAIPLLVQLIRSQQPTRELGQQAYQQLYELGFVEDAFPRK
ncbi:MAG: hypothetical protein SFT94_00045 [Pseudanabaenaceae cyanobacterium bins.68]|nr:hypothetical protein [Pseudanabaenaceae cyanobacterium bins.68]